MALYILNPGISPLGDFDVLDTDAANIVGGELMTFDKAARVNSSSEKASFDVYDGYIGLANSTTEYRTVARIADNSSETYKVFYLADEGKAGYGVMFGTVIGYPVGLGTTGTNLGPSTLTGSGKVTLWDKQGLYAVSLTAVSSDIVPTSPNFDTPLPGTTLYRETNTGKLCKANGTGDKVAAFIELSSNGSLVTTPSRLATGTETFDRIKIQFAGATYNLA